MFVFKLQFVVYHNKKNVNINVVSTVKVSIISILTYVSETWTMYARQERTTNWIHLLCLSSAERILNISVDHSRQMFSGTNQRNNYVFNLETEAVVMALTCL